MSQGQLEGVGGAFSLVLVFSCFVGGGAWEPRPRGGRDGERMVVGGEERPLEQGRRGRGIVAGDGSTRGDRVDGPKGVVDPHGTPSRKDGQQIFRAP